uniref:Uncharacterized protein n=1 Tax=Anopheles maculatus TaxID=74869 RepID=A0A182SRJ5_9DIPT
ELDEEAEDIDPELENLPLPPPPPGSPPPELQQPRCLNPPVVRMIDFREGGFHGIGLSVPGMAPPTMHLAGANGASMVGLPPPLPVPPVTMPVSGSVPVPGPTSAAGYRHPNVPPHHMLPSHLGAQRPASPHGTLALHHHPHPIPPPSHHLYHHHPGHGPLLVPPPHHAVYPPQQTMPSSALITITSGKKRSSSTVGGNGVHPIESIVSNVATPTPMASSNTASGGGVSAMFDGTPP